MSIKKEGDKWRVDLRPSGRNGKRFRKLFDKKNEALAYEKHILATHHNKEWLGLPEDRRQLSELIEIWWKKSGQFKRSAEDYRNKLNIICNELNNPQANKINNSLISDWKTYRLEKGQSPATIRRMLSPLSNVFTVLIDSGDFTAQHPIKGISRPKEPVREMTFLTYEQVKILLNDISHDKEMVSAVKISLATGSRWTETISLKATNLTPYRIRFTDTKTGKHRTVPISKALYEEVYPEDGGALFLTNPHHNLRQRIGKLFDLPKGQKNHVLRHTFASHFMINGGSILTLKEILGHSSITQTMTYAHLAPDHLQDAVRLNPLDN
ncbi:tyrosine-type recombinase/integrase [Vibrio sp. DW001]|uniref:phage integrase n=1 Tax=Vibrio sp. DW001 TaxID=2912315 RepID=UPI0023AF2FB1|nr:tyrosine-type recombinase/integrase [Vibrio sp. DW001]WED28133.1 tyrosine-type recombinase/integrase [Vibrio sp. DW001]